MSNIISGRGGCTACAGYGFDSTSLAVAYLIASDTLRALKVGVTGATTDRLDFHRGEGWNVVATRTNISGREARAIEQRVVAAVRATGLPVPLLRPTHMPR
jgi:hypothetical protein